MRTHLTVEQRQLALRLRARGLSLREIGPQVGCSHQGVALIVRHASRRPVLTARLSGHQVMINGNVLSPPSRKDHPGTAAHADAVIPNFAASARRRGP